MKVVINRCFGGFGLSDAAYEKLIEWGIPVRAYIEEQRDPMTGRFLPEPNNEGEVIFDRNLTPDSNHYSFMSRYWEVWIGGQRTHPLLIRVVEELGSEQASGRHAELTVVEIPDGVEYTIDEYDGNEHIAEVHRTWR